MRTKTTAPDSHHHPSEVHLPIILQIDIGNPRPKIPTHTSLARTRLPRLEMPMSEPARLVKQQHPKATAEHPNPPSNVPTRTNPFFLSADPYLLDGSSTLNSKINDHRVVKQTAPAALICHKPLSTDQNCTTGTPFITPTLAARHRF